MYVFFVGREERKEVSRARVVAYPCSLLVEREPATGGVNWSWESALLSIYLCVYGHTYGKSMDQPGKVASPARGQLNRKNEYFSVRVRA